MLQFLLDVLEFTVKNVPTPILVELLDFQEISLALLAFISWLHM